MTGVDTAYKYAMIGHGDQPGDVDSGNTVSGDLTLRVGGNADLENAFIGHQIDADGTYSSGNTYVGVVGTLTTDEYSQFTSANYSSGGELRIYLVSDTADAVDSSATLNGFAHGAATTPNNQGDYSFGGGAYDGSPTELTANVNYYTLAGLYNYSVGLDEANAIILALGSGDITLSTDLNQFDFGARYDIDGGTQYINIDSAIFYDSENALSLLATGDINLNASIQNRNATGGDVNLVAGWDRSITFNATTFAAEDVSTTTLFGNNAGSIYIGDGT
ncbi:MAG: hypothetical protein GY784_04380, partial [Gammaproteobacteria bacterium]|nr:hypothetical protein [Gammaproteobacteria bacterium]